MKPSISLQRATKKLLKPLVRLLLNNNISFNEVSEWIRELFVEVAEQEFKIEGKVQTSTRVSVLTGISRKDVARIRKNIPKPTEKTKSSNRLIRIVSAWAREEGYINEEGHPVAINIEGPHPSLESLTKEHGGDVSYQAIKSEMARLGVADFNGDMVTLKASAFIPSKDKSAQFDLMGSACADLLSSIDHNIENPEKTRLQLSVAYEGLDSKTVNNFKKLSEKQSLVLLKKMDRWLSENMNEEECEEDSHRAGIGIYYFEDKKR